MRHLYLQMWQGHARNECLVFNEKDFFMVAVLKSAYFMYFKIKYKNFQPFSLIPEKSYFSVSESHASLGNRYRGLTSEDPPWRKPE
jgi:hypothetical protein